MSRRIARREWAWALTVAAVTVALSSIPYVAGYLSQTPDHRFIGAVYDWEDYYSHLAKMQQGMRGAWDYHILFTPEDHPGAPINTFYIALGHLTGALGLSPLPVYHLTRIVCAMILLATVYGFIGAFVPADGRRTGDHGGGDHGGSPLRARAPARRTGGPPCPPAHRTGGPPCPPDGGDHGGGNHGGSPLRDGRRVAYLLACFSSGLGWLVLLLTRSYTLGGITPVDFWLIEMTTFFTVLTFPHTCLALAAHLIAFARMVRGLRGEGDWRDGLVAAGATLLLAVIHPYSLLPLDASLGGYALFRLVRYRRAALPPLLLLFGFVLLPLPLVWNQYRAIAANPVLSAWQAQSTTFSPPPLHYVLGYGLVLILAVWGGARAVRAREEAATPLLLWPLIVAPLLYAPIVFNLQRRMIEGVQVPLAILAATGLVDGLLPAVQRSRLAGWLARRGYRRPRFGRLVALLTLALTTPSTLYLLLSLTLGVTSGYGPLYTSQAEMAAVRWLGEHGAPTDTVLSSYEIGGLIPAWSGRRVFWGHWAETIDLAHKRVEAEAFYSSDEFDRPAFLARYDIAYVFHGPRERALGGFDPAAAPYLEPVFRQGDVTLYRVESEP